MKMDCIPAGMEHFPAADEEQWNFIKRIIDYSDYYLLIIGGRYGSLDDDGLSFTEKEYDYAVSKNIKVVALIHGSPETLTFQNSEQEPSLREKLQAFRDKVKTKRLVDFWTSANELPGKVALGIMNARTMHPAIGWVRADRVSNENSLIEINNLRKENSDLIIKNNSLENEIKSKSYNYQSIPDLASIESEFTVSYSGYVSTRYSQSERVTWKAVLTWKDIFHHISPMLTSFTHVSGVEDSIIKCAIAKTGSKGRTMVLDEQDFFTISVQFQAYGLVKVEHLKNTKGGMSDFWILTDKGKKLMIQLRTIKE